MARPSRIWLFNPYGPLPGEGWRDYSYVAIARALAAAGHDVTWWTSNFSHHLKTFRSAGWENRAVAAGVTVRLVPTPAYRRNIGPGRFLRDAVFGWRAYRRARGMAPPDLILTSEPATMGGFAGVRLAQRSGAALVYDQMDLWPELMVQALPRRVQPLAEALFAPVYRFRRAMFRRLDGALALAEPYLASILAERTDAPPIPTLIVYNGIDVPAFRAAMGRPLPGDLAARFERPGIKAIFAGSLGPSYDVDAMIDAARMQGAATIYVAGDGPERPRVEAAAAACPGLVYLGKLAPDLLPAVYARCDVGLACYSARSNVEMCDKFYDYTAAGLAIVNSLDGEVRGWIERFGLGLHYRAGDGASLAGALERIAADPAAAARWKAASWAIGPRFDTAAQHAPLAAFVAEVVARRASVA